MDSTNEILHDFSPLFRVFKDGWIERLKGNDIVPASIDPATGVQSKDVKINADSGVCARLYVPTSIEKDHKLPLLVYFHGGGFVIETAFSPVYHTHLNNLVAQANIIVVSVDYRRVPEHPLPIAFEDSWDAVHWVASHSSRNGQDPWLNEYADFRSVFFAGDSAGANIAHNMAIRLESENPDGLNVEGIVLVHPSFWGKEALSGELLHPEASAYMEKKLLYTSSGISGLDDPLINPGLDPRISDLRCKRVIIFVAEKDVFKNRGFYYQELLENSSWCGEVEVVETKDESHVFHLFSPKTDKAVSLVGSVASFINEGKIV